MEGDVSNSTHRFSMSQTEEQPLPSKKAYQRYSCGFSRVSGPCWMQSASLPHIQDCCFAMDGPVADV